MIRVRDLKLLVGESEDLLIKKACKKIGCSPKDINEIKIFRRSLDARKKSSIFYNYTIDLSVKNEEHFLKKAKDKSVSKAGGICGGRST